MRRAFVPIAVLGFLPALLLMGATGELEAQRSGANGQAGQAGQPGQLTRPQMLRRIEEQFQAQIAQELQLNAEQRAQLTEVLSDYATSRGEILPRRMQLEREIRETLAQGGAEDEARRLILEVRALREREEEVMVEEEERLLEFLQPSQVLRLQFLRDQFGNRIRIIREQDGPIQLRTRGGGSPNGTQPPSGGRSGN